MRIFITLSLLLLNICAYSQCIGNPIYENCEDPLVICDLNTINGFTGCTPEAIGNITDPFCDGTGVLDNPAFFSFIAGSDELVISISMGACNAPNGIPGLQANVINPCDPNICYADNLTECFNTDFTITANDLVVGQEYQLVIDGCSGSECEFTINIESAPAFISADLNLMTNGQAECLSSVESYQCDGGCPNTSLEWFKINTDSDAAILMFEINGNAFTPVVEIRQGTCDGEIVEYEQGDNLDFYANIVASESYFIGVSSSLGNISDFFICASAFLQLVDCTNQVELERFRPSNPDENPDGPYCPGETVNFCYSVDFTIGDAGDPDGNNCQWIQGIVPVLGCGWDLETIDIADQAPPGWFWLDENEVDYNVENPSLSLSNTCCGTVGLEYLGGSLSPGDELPGGFWFTSPGGTGCTNDGDPDNMWGLPGGCGSTQSVEFCFDLRAKILQGVDCADDCIKDLSVHMFTFADGETGCWSNASCAGDVPIIFDALSGCDEDSCGQDIDSDGFSSLLDCDDNDPSINPNAEELCDGIDNNCNGLIDEDACNLNTCTGDIIFEGGAGSFQNTDSLVTQEFSFGFPDCKLICISLDVSTNGEAWIGPGNLETPNECEFGVGVGCEGDPFNSTAGDCDMCWDFIMAQIFIGDSLVYQNILGDDPEDELEVTWNTQINGADFPDTILGTVLISGQTFANAENLSFSNLMVTCLEYFDEDGDGFNSIFDCDDNNADIYPGAIEICDSIDNNCDGQIDEGATTFYYEDLDGDGYGNPMTLVESCDPVAGYSLNNTDCDDTNANINEGAIEIPNNGTDENCDGMDEVQGDDNDNDGYFGNDCNDTDPTINPGAIEICDGIDNNCDGQIDEGFSAAINYYQDNDGDGYGNPEVSLQSCAPVAGYTLNNTDCDDSNEAINEAAIEIPDNGIDEDCDGSDLITGIDIDKDGFFNDVDCDDTNPLINPAADEICDGLDNNCDGEIDEGFEFVIFYSDADMDGYGTGEGFTDCIQPPDTSTEGGDCDDTNPDINPGATEIGGNGIDEDCDGVDGPSATQNIGDHTFTFYPNPTNDLIYIQTEEANKLKYELFDIKGKLKANGKVDQEINLSNFNTGVYLMKIIDIDSGEHSFVRIIKI